MLLLRVLSNYVMFKLRVEEYLIRKQLVENWINK